MITSFLFFPEKNYCASPQDFGLAGEEVFITTSDGVRLAGWFFAAEGAPMTLLHFHGNAGNISGRLAQAKLWRQQGASVLLFDYRGYGKSAGKIEKGNNLLEDAHAALRWLENEKKIPSERIVLYGESLGSYPAVHVAQEKKLAGLVLEAPFTNLLELARIHYSWVPEMILKDFPMHNEKTIANARAPVFILHGSEDEICPVAMGERLYETAPAPKELYVIPGANHNNLLEVAQSAYVEHPYAFLVRENGFV